MRHSIHRNDLSRNPLLLLIPIITTRHKQKQQQSNSTNSKTTSSLQRIRNRRQPHPLINKLLLSPTRLNQFQVHTSSTKRTPRQSQMRTLRTRSNHVNSPLHYSLNNRIMMRLSHTRRRLTRAHKVSHLITRSHPRATLHRQQRQQHHNLQTRRQLQHRSRRQTHRHKVRLPTRRVRMKHQHQQRNSNRIILHTRLRRPLSTNQKIIKTLAFMPIQRRRNRQQTLVPFLLTHESRLISSHLYTISRITRLNLPRRRNIKTNRKMTMLRASNNRLARRQIMSPRFHTITMALLG